MEIDFALIHNRVMVKTFAITNKDGSLHNMTGSTVIMRVYKTAPVDLPAVIGGLSMSELTFTFNSPVNDTIGDFEYEIFETPSGGPPIKDLGRGNITWLSATDFTTQVYTLIDGEALPFGITVDPNFRTQSVTYWKLYLQPQFNILDADIEDDSKWPTLVRFLIAKLVLHDFIVGTFKGALISSFGTTSSSASPGFLKKLETGPSNAEWHDGGDSLAQLLKVGGDGQSAFDKMKVDIVNLAHRVRAHIPMVGHLDYSPMIPLKAEGCYVDIETIVLEYYG